MITFIALLFKIDNDEEVGNIVFCGLDVKSYIFLIDVYFLALIATKKNSFNIHN